MSSYQFTPQAIEDLLEIWSYIAGDDFDAANRVEEAIHAACASWWIRRMPEAFAKT
jgi:plasmid stabilization system protein ParE